VLIKDVLRNKTLFGGTTNNDGDCVNSQIAGGTYKITASYMLYKPAQIDSIVVEEGDILSIVFELAFAGGDVVVCPVISP
jgi:hypothetical protein